MKEENDTKDLRRARVGTPPGGSVKFIERTQDDCSLAIKNDDKYLDWGNLGNRKEVIWYDNESETKINLILEFDQQKSLFNLKTHHLRDYEPKAFGLTDNNGYIQKKYAQQAKTCNELKNLIESTFTPIKDCFFDINR